MHTPQHQPQQQEETDMAASGLPPVTAAAAEPAAAPTAAAATAAPAAATVQCIPLKESSKGSSGIWHRPVVAAVAALLLLLLFLLLLPGAEIQQQLQRQWYSAAAAAAAASLYPLKTNVAAAVTPQQVLVQHLFKEELQEQHQLQQDGSGITSSEEATGIEQQQQQQQVDPDVLSAVLLLQLQQQQRRRRTSSRGAVPSVLLLQSLSEALAAAAARPGAAAATAAAAAAAAEEGDLRDALLAEGWVETVKARQETIQLPQHLRPLLLQHSGLAPQDVLLQAVRSSSSSRLSAGLSPRRLLTASVYSKAYKQLVEAVQPDRLTRAVKVGGQYIYPWGVFTEQEREQLRLMADQLKWLPKWIRNHRVARRPPPRALNNHLPVLKPKFTDSYGSPGAVSLGSSPGVRYTWLGHASGLLLLDGLKVLIDPVLGDDIVGAMHEWAKKFLNFVNNKLCGRLGERLRPSPLRISELPQDLHLVILSHNHQDHVMEGDVIKLCKTYRSRFQQLMWYVPEGVAWFLIKHGCSPQRVFEFTWGEERALSCMRRKGQYVCANGVWTRPGDAAAAAAAKESFSDHRDTAKHPWRHSAAAAAAAGWQQQQQQHKGKPGTFPMLPRWDGEADSSSSSSAAAAAPGVSPPLRGLQQQQEQQQEADQFLVTYVGTVHWSGRSPGKTDHNTSLWGGFAIRGPHHNFFYGGDTSYLKPSFDEFKKIGRVLGPFHLAAVAIGAYEPNDDLRYQHANPAEALQLSKDVRAEVTVGVHWGTMRLSAENLFDPMLELECALLGLTVAACRGETNRVSPPLGSGASTAADTAETTAAGGVSSISRSGRSRASRRSSRTFTTNSSSSSNSLEGSTSEGSLGDREEETETLVAGSTVTASVLLEAEPELEGLPDLGSPSAHAAPDASLAKHSGLHAFQNSVEAFFRNPVGFVRRGRRPHSIRDAFSLNRKYKYTLQPVALWSDPRLHPSNARRLRRAERLEALGLLGDDPHWREKLLVEGVRFQTIHIGHSVQVESGDGGNYLVMSRSSARDHIDPSAPPEQYVLLPLYFKGSSDLSNRTDRRDLAAHADGYGVAASAAAPKETADLVAALKRLQQRSLQPRRHLRPPTAADMWGSAAAANPTARAKEPLGEGEASFDVLD